MSDAWNPTQYERFAAERAQPFHDLAALVERRPGFGGRPPRVVDLGCGTGALTATLAATLGAGELLGIDSSPAMLAAAAPHATDTVRFEQGDIGTWRDDGAWDVVFANASLQWVRDHEAVVARWVAALAPGGQLAVQVPANDDHASHRAAAEVAARPEFAADFTSAPGGVPPADIVAANVLAPVAYAELLHRLGCERQHVRLQVYPHVLGSTDDVVEWTKGTTLTRFAPCLRGERYDAFVAAYRERVRELLGDARPCFYPFKRILFRASRPG